MRMALFSILSIFLSGCAIIEEQNMKIRTTEQKLNEVAQKVQVLEESNQSLKKQLDEYSQDGSTNRRLTTLEQKQAGMEKMQLELIQYQDSLKSSVSKVRQYVDELRQKMEELKAPKETAQKASKEKPVAQAREEEKPTSGVDIKVNQKALERPEKKEELKGFILEDF